MHPPYRTLEADIHHEIEKIQGSRFLGWAFPMGDEPDLMQRLETARADHPDACHHVFAYRLGAKGQSYRYSDDGEPSGTAGKPMLMQIENRELTHTGVIVVRYFGGKKLGTGGLSRAYSAAAQETLDSATIHTVVAQQRIQTLFPYDLSSVMDAFLAAENVVPLERSYEADVRLTFEIPFDEADAFCARLTERSASRIKITREDAKS